MRNSNKSVLSVLSQILFAVLLPLALVGCGVKDTSPSASDLLARVNGGDSSVAEAAEAVTPTVSTGDTASTSGALSSAAADRLTGEVKKLEALLTNEGFTLSNSVSNCTGTPEERIICASDQLAALEKAFAAVINGMKSLQEQYDAVLKELNDLRTQRGNAGNTGVAAGSGSSNTSSGGYYTGSPWQCVLDGGPGVQWDQAKQDFFVIYNNERFYSLSGVRYTWYKDRNGNVIIGNVNTVCNECHPMGKYAHAMCEAPGGGNNGGGNNGSNNGSGNSSDAEARARAEADARARAEVDVHVKVDVAFEVKQILVSYGVIGGTPIPGGTCMCTMEFAPVCVQLPDGRIITFPNSCMATCAGLKNFVSCSTVPTITPVVINDPLCAMFPNHPDCKKTPTVETPTPTCTPKPGEPTATRPPVTATLPPTGEPGDPCEDHHLLPGEEWVIPDSWGKNGQVIGIKGDVTVNGKNIVDSFKNVGMIWIHVKAGDVVKAVPGSSGANIIECRDEESLRTEMLTVDGNCGSPTGCDFVRVCDATTGSCTWWLKDCSSGTCKFIKHEPFWSNLRLGSYNAGDKVKLGQDFVATGARIKIGSKEFGDTLADTTEVMVCRDPAGCEIELLDGGSIDSLANTTVMAVVDQQHRTGCGSGCARVHLFEWNGRVLSEEWLNR